MCYLCFRLKAAFNILGHIVTVPTLYDITHNDVTVYRQWAYLPYCAIRRCARETPHVLEYTTTEFNVSGWTHQINQAYPSILEATDPTNSCIARGCTD